MWRRKLPPERHGGREPSGVASSAGDGDAGRPKSLVGRARESARAALRFLSRCVSRLRRALRRSAPPLLDGPDPQTSPSWVEGGKTAQIGTTTEAERDLLRVLLELTTGLWRIRRATPPPNDDESPDELRRLRRHVDATWDILASAGVEVRDHTGGRYVTGMALKVLAFQPVAGVTVEVIDETVKPSIFYKDRLRQPGEVIVATPEAARDGSVEARGQPPAAPDDPGGTERGGTSEQ